jgi:hypothetical protein
VSAGRETELPLGDAREATPEWLTEVLRRAGVLGRGRVATVDYRPNDAFNSSVTHLTVGYDREVTGAPNALVLKLNRDRWGEAEVGIYRLAMAEARPVPAMVPCFAAAYDAATGRSHCLLLDVSATHAPPVTRRQVLALDAVPSERRLEAMVDALAAFHAHWWTHAGAGTGVLRPPETMSTSAARAKRAADRAAQFARFLATAGSSVSRQTTRLCEDALGGLPALWERTYGQRFDEGRQLTLVNGDCYFAQFLCPREPGPALAAGGGAALPTYLVDFQEACFFLPAEDLVFMFATFWTRAQRREGDRELRLLRRYLRRLEEHGVRGYTWDLLMADYRLSIVYMLFRTIWDQTSGAAEGYWRPKLDCVIASYQDHDCAGLFDAASAAARHAARGTM